MSSVLSLRPRLPFRRADSVPTDGSVAQENGSAAVEEETELEIIPLEEPVISLSARGLRVLGESEEEDGDINHLTIHEGENDDLEHDDDEMRSGCKGRLIFTALLSLIFIATVTVAIRAWIQYEAKQFAFFWIEEPCVVLDSHLDIEKSQSSDFFRLKGKVNGSYPLAKKFKDAYYGRNDEYLLNQTEAESIERNFNFQKTPCWIRKANHNIISLQDVGPTADEDQQTKRSLYLAWTMTLVAAVVGLLTVTLASHWMHEVFNNAVDSIVADARQNDKRKKCLTAEQAVYLCEVGEEVLRSGDERLKDWVCPVCLEENVKGGMVRTVVLSCSHRYHRGCIAKWMRKGRAACPMCHWDARTLFDDGGKPIRGADEKGIASEPCNPDISDANNSNSGGA